MEFWKALTPTLMCLALRLTVFLVIGFLADFNGRHNLYPTLEVMRVLISYFVSTNIFVVNVMLVLSSGIIINILTVSFL